MWIYSNNFGKWSSSSDTLTKNTFDLLKQELSSTRFYSRILSGATFIPVNDLDNIYDILGEWEPRNWYVNTFGSQYSETMSPTRNAMGIDTQSSYEYYTKFIAEYGLTLKTLFTADRLIKDSINNYYHVDLATTEQINLNQISNAILIDGSLLIKGHKVLVKDQKSIDTLPGDQDASTYFVGEYSLIEDLGGTRTYEYFNNENGIYIFDGKRLVKDNVLDDYSNCVRYSVHVNMGVKNAEKQFHLKRLLNGYFPTSSLSEPMSFVEKHNWMLRNRVDYNNLFEINYYDVIKHGTQSYQIEGVTYSIPPRTISVGEFGVILNTQNLSGLQGTSNIINNKYKVNLRSISQTSTHYWVCGDDSILLKVRKHDFFIERTIIDTLSNLTSVSFFNDLRGAVVGEFNTIFITTNGGQKWNRLKIADFAPYTYSKVLFTDASRFYVGGRNGVFLEMYEDQAGWTALKRRIFKEIDDDDEYLLVEGINDLYKTTITATGSLGWGLSYSFGTNSTSNTKELMFIAANNGNLVVYDMADATEFDFLYLDFGKNYGDIRNVTRQSNTNNFYFTGADGLYSFDINSFKYIGVGNTYSNTIAGTYATIKSSLYANEIFDYEENELIIAGNNSLLKTTNYGSTLTFNLLDDNFENRLKSKLLFMDYDIGAKLNWFTDQGDYRMPNSITFSAQNSYKKNANGTLSTTRSTEYLFDIGFGPIIYGATAPSMLTQSECNWLTYWIDSQKTFEYYSKYPLNEYAVSGITGSMVLISTTFSFASGALVVGATPTKENKIKLYKGIMSNDLTDIIKLAPSFAYSGTQSSRYDMLNRAIISAPVDLAPIKLYLYDYLIILKVPTLTYTYRVGDVARIESGIVDSNFIVNKTWVNGTSTYVYMYSEFNQTMITDLILNAGDTLATSNVSIVNLNRYKDIDELVYNFNLHPVSNAYKLQITGSASYLSYDLSITPKFNNLTSYYNLATKIYQKTYKYQTSTYGNYSKEMIYTSGFLKFGYTATYNLLDYLESINKVSNGLSTFYASKEYLAMPIYKDIPLGSFGSGNIYIDSNGITQSSTTGNKLMFGEKLKLEWESVMINTFVDVSIYQPDAGNTYETKRLLVMNKYKIENLDDLGLSAYVIEFHKKINFKLNTSLNDGTIDIISRRSLLQISEDLQEMNNIQKAKLSTKHIVNDTFGYNNYQSELNFKVPTDSYAKIFLSDADTVDSLSAIMYVDYKNELAMNITRLDRDFNIPITNTVDFNGQLFITCSEKHKLSKDDGVVLEFNGGSQSSADINQNYFGYRVVTQVYGEYDFAVDLPYGNEAFVGSDSGYVRYVKKDPFLNYQPVDLIDIGLNKKGDIAIELGVENSKLQDGKFKLVDVDFNKYRFRLIDGLNIETVSLKYPWLLEAEVSGAVIGMDTNKDIIWYKGIWEGGRWFGGTWISGTWKLGDWYAGTWNSKMIKDNKISVEIDKKSSDEFQSTWYTGRWFDGTWNNGTWINGRFYDGEWNAGVWNNGTWNDGTWNGGRFIGGIWVTGEWNGGIFNTDNEPAYWIDGVWNGGDFENGMWYNGSFESKNTDARFGTKAYNSRTATWHGGKWLSGSFFSKLGTTPDVSDVHKYSIWHTGQWISGDFYGGVAYNIDFKSGTWHGGILEDIQIIGMNENNNSFVLNGIFKFNIGDEFYVIDNYVGNELSVLYGSNGEPKKYIVLYTVEDSINEYTEVYVATNVADFSGRFVSYKKANNEINATFSTNSIIVNTISTTGVRETIKDVKVKINLSVQNRLVERYTPVAQYKVGGLSDPLGISTWELPLGTSPGVIFSAPPSNPYPALPLYADPTVVPKSVATVTAGWQLSPLFSSSLPAVNNPWTKVGTLSINSASPRVVVGIGTLFISQVEVGSDIYLYKADITTPSTTSSPTYLGRVASITNDTSLLLQNDFVPYIWTAGSTNVNEAKSYYFYDYTIPASLGYPLGRTNFAYKFRCNTNNGIGGPISQSNFLSQNLIGVRKSDSLGVAKLQWGFTPNGYNGPGYAPANGPMVYRTNNGMIGSYGNTYVARERVLDPISLNDITTTTIVSGTTYSTSDEIYGYRIEISEDHLFESYFARYEVGLTYSYVVSGLASDRYYYFRVSEIKSSGIGGLRINLRSPSGQTIGLKEFNQGNDDTNMIDTVFSYDQSLPVFDSGKPIYEGDFKMNLGKQSLVTTGKLIVDNTRLILDSSTTLPALFLQRGVMPGSRIYATTTMLVGGFTMPFEKYLGVVKTVSDTKIVLVSAATTAPFVSSTGLGATVPFVTGTPYNYSVDKYLAKCELLISDDLYTESLISKNNLIYTTNFANLVGTTQYANGDWTLSIENTSGVNIGHLQNWEIQFGYSDVLGAQLYDKTPAIDTGLRLVSNFKNANWKTGIWTNGIFDEGIFETGIWYNGVFNGTWG